MTRPKALLIGQGMELMVSLPSLLNRSGFDIDIISNISLLKKSNFISKIETISDPNYIVQTLSEKNLDIYDFIIPCDDIVLNNILNSDLTLTQKLQILPVKSKSDFQHLYSKIGLAKTLSKTAILTPESAVANDLSQAKEISNKIGFPLLVKVDSSNGGIGVFECNNFDDIDLIDPRIFNLPVLIQKKIIGKEYDLSAIYRDTKLLHFSCSSVERFEKNKFGPSVVRTYKQIGCLEKELYLELVELGKAVGANGFTNIACIQSSEDGKRYFIECDMRPNAWVDFNKFLGNDPAIIISKWFKNKETIQIPHPINEDYPTELLLPLYLRMSLKDIICNRDRVWKYLPKEDPALLLSILQEQLLRINFVKKLKHPLKTLNRIPTYIIRLLLPHKEQRVRLRLKIRKLFYPFKTNSIFKKIFLFKTTIKKSLNLAK